MKVSELRALSVTQLKALRGKIDKAIARAEDTKKAEALNALKKSAKALGFSLEELVDGRLPAKKRGPKANAKAKPKAKAGIAKYANPADRSQTWTGKGRRPGWVNEALDAGKDLDDLKI